MLATFIIGLREGVEASLIVGIIAAFLVQRGACRELRLTWVGVGVAIALCLGIAVVLELLDRGLPQREQEALEAAIAVVAVVMVTTMIVWMSRHARTLRRDLERDAAIAMSSGSSRALVLMACFAVLREGLETAVFLLAAFQATGDRAGSAAGAALGIGVAVVIGWLIYRGGMRINLARFFASTGLVLVLVAGGLVAFALHAGHEAGWVNVGQTEVADLSWLVPPGSVRNALLGGMFGLRAHPTAAELLGWTAYVVPVGGYVIATWWRGRASHAPRHVAV